MRRMFVCVGVGIGVAGLVLAASTALPARVQAAPAPADGQDAAAALKMYSDKVVPIFQANCYRCHGGMNHRGGFQMDTKAGMAKGGHDGAVLVPGSPEKSLLVKLIRHEGPADDPMPMPPNKPGSRRRHRHGRAVVKAGAIMPEDAPK